MIKSLDRYEKIILGLTILGLIVGAGAIVVSVLEAGIHLPTVEGRIDPAEVRQTAPFDAPGVHDNGDGTYQAVIVAQTWLWEPDTIEVPVGSEVEFVITSLDVIHGFHVWDTALNAMVIPGQITKVTQRFDTAGEFGIVCHEYCGIGHHDMFGRVVVTP